MCSKLHSQRLGAEHTIKEEQLRSEGYCKLHEDLVQKLRILADKNHSLEIDLQRTKHDNASLRGQLDDAERRLDCMKSNLGNYSQEVNVHSYHEATEELHGCSGHCRQESTGRARRRPAFTRSQSPSTTGGCETS